MHGKHQIAPNATNLFGVLANQLANQIIAQQRHNSTATLPNCIAISKPNHTIAVRDLDKRRLLAVKRLDRIGATDLRFEVDHKDINSSNFGHGLYLMFSDVLALWFTDWMKPR